MMLGAEPKEMTLPHNTDGSGRIQIHRKATLWRDRVRAYKVLIDGNTVGKVRNGETADFAVASGRHTVRLKIAWSGSPERVVEVRPEDQTVLVASARPALLAMPDLLISLFWRNRWVALEVSHDPPT
jgi:hypothetical protein